MTRNLFFIAVFLAFFVFSGCQTSHQVALAPVEIKPIHITIDVNVRVEKALDDFFKDIEAAESKIKK